MFLRALQIWAGNTQNAPAHAAWGFVFLSRKPHRQADRITFSIGKTDINPPSLSGEGAFCYPLKTAITAANSDFSFVLPIPPLLSEQNTSNRLHTSDLIMCKSLQTRMLDLRDAYPQRKPDS